MEEETPQQRAWRQEFETWPETKLRMFAVPSTTSMSYDEKQAFALAVLAERESNKRDAREAETLDTAKRANVTARSAARWAAIAAVAAIVAAVAAIVAAIPPGIEIIFGKH